MRRIAAAGAGVPETDLARVRAEVARHPRLRSYRVEAVKGEIVIHEPRGGVSPDMMSALSGVSPDMMSELGKILGVASWPARAPTRDRTRFEPVLKYVPNEEPGGYDVLRMTYRGDGGWSWPLASGPLRKLVKEHIRLLGTDKLFEAY